MSSGAAWTGAARRRDCGSSAAPQDTTNYCYYWYYQWCFELPLHWLKDKVKVAFGRFGRLQFSWSEILFFLNWESFIWKSSLALNSFTQKPHLLVRFGRSRVTDIVFSILEYLNECFFKFGTWGSKINSFGGQKAKVRVLLHFFITICWNKQPLLKKKKKNRL